MKYIPSTTTLLVCALAYSAIVLLTCQQDMLFAIQDFTPWQTGWDFFHSYLSRPYGPVAWLAAMLTSLFYHPWLGVTVLVALWGISCSIIRTALRLPRCVEPLTVLPVFCLLVPLTQTGYWLYIVKLAAWWYLPTLLWLWWAVAVWLAARVRPWWAKALSTAAWSCVLTPWNGLAVHAFDSIDSFMLIPLWALVATAVAMVAAKVSCTAIATSPKTERRLAWTMLPVLCAAVVWSVMLNYRNPSFHAEIRMERMAERGDWQAITDEVNGSRRKPTLSMILMRDIALMHTGRLKAEENTLRCDGVRPEMLHGPKVYLAYTTGPMLYYLAGYVNDAYRWSLENAVEYGFAPQRLRIMLMCAMQNGEWDLARKYVRLLGMTFFHKAFADSMKPLIGHPERFASNPALAAVSRIRQRHTHLIPALIYMEPVLFNDKMSPLKYHKQCHLEGKTTTY